MISIVIIDQSEQQQNMKTAVSIFSANLQINFLFLNQKGCLLGSDKPVTLPFKGDEDKYEQHIFRHYECDHDQSVVKVGEIVTRDTKHVHHDIMIALAKNKNLKIQYRSLNLKPQHNPEWINAVNPSFGEDYEYRIKPETITVGGFTDYPKPPESFTEGQKYYIAGKWFTEIISTGYWDSESYYLKTLREHNLVFATQEDSTKATEILTKILTGVTPNA